MNTIICADCQMALLDLPNESIDLVVTSPPYADQRKNSYGGIHPDHYVDWFLPIAEQLQRVLKPAGTFILNIKEKATNGERHTYVLELILALKKQGWLWTEEFIWHKKNSYPGKWPNRFRDAWERCLQFNKQPQFAMYQESVMVPIGAWAEKRLQNLSENDHKRPDTGTGSFLTRNVSNWQNRTLVYPTNVLLFATECANQQHSAAFPLELPTWFIKLFTQEGDVVLDPFLGSGTTAVAAKKLNRNYVGIELSSDYCQIAQQRLDSTEKVLF